MGITINHYNIVTSVVALFSASFYCRKCEVASQEKGQQICPNACRLCYFETRCIETDFQTRYTNFNYRFKNRDCYERHKTVKVFPIRRTVCQVKFWCWERDTPVNYLDRKSTHKCLQLFCTMWKEYMDPYHLCYRKPPPIRDFSKSVVYVFMDLECSLDENYSEGSDTISKDMYRACA